MTTAEIMEYGDEDFGEEVETCECELDWCCSLHRHLPTPEDRIATAWSQSTRAPEEF